MHVESPYKLHRSDYVCLEVLWFSGILEEINFFWIKSYCEKLISCISSRTEYSVMEFLDVVNSLVF